MTGEKLDQADWFSSSEAERPATEAGFTGSSGAFARFQNREKGAARQETIRNRFELSEVTRAGFGLG